MTNRLRTKLAITAVLSSACTIVILVVAIGFLGEEVYVPLRQETPDRWFAHSGGLAGSSVRSTMNAGEQMGFEVKVTSATDGIPLVGVDLTLVEDPTSYQTENIGESEGGPGVVALTTNNEGGVRFLGIPRRPLWLVAHIDTGGLISVVQQPVPSLLFGERRVIEWRVRTTLDSRAEGRVLDANSQLPISGAVVTVVQPVFAFFRDQKTEENRELSREVTDDNGTFSIAAPSWGGDCILRVDHQGHGVEVAALSRLARIGEKAEFVLSQSSALTCTFAFDRGRVPEGARAIIGTDLSALVEERADYRRFSSLYTSWEASLDDAGRAVFDDLPAKTALKLRLVDADGQLLWRSFEFLELQPGEVRAESFSGI